MSNLLVVDRLEVFYGPVRAVKGVSFSIQSGEIHTIIGANGAGKSTILRAIAGITPPSAGRIEFPEGTRIDGKAPHSIRNSGVAWVPEGREIFDTLTVEENLRMGAYLVRDRPTALARMTEMYELFPVLYERRQSPGASLSGGEQQMLAIARALMSGPRLLLMDEPSLGLAPKIVSAVFAMIRRIHSAGISIVLVEQNVRQALAVADYAHLLELGEVRLEGPVEDFTKREDIQQVYLGTTAFEAK